MKVSDSSYKVRKNSAGRLTENITSNGEVWYYGTVTTPLGYVHVHSEPTFTSLCVIHDGYEVNRFIKGRQFSQRGLATVARRFIEEIQHDPQDNQ